jgi:WD40 repeat protein
VYTLEKSDNEHTFFSSGGDGMVVKWDFLNPDQGEVVAKVDNSIYALQYLPQYEWLVVGQNFKGLHVINMKEKSEIRNIQFTESAIFDILATPTQLVAATSEGKVYVFNLPDFSIDNIFNFSDKSARCLAFDGESGHLAVGYSDHAIRIVKEGVLLKEIFAHSNSVFSLAYSPNGSELLSAGRDAHLKIHNTQNNYALKESIVAHMYAINHLTYSPNGLFYATASMDKSIKLWDAKKHKLLKVIDKSRHAGHGTSVNKLLWTKHEDFLVSVSDDRTVSVWSMGLDQL